QNPAGHLARWHISQRVTETPRSGDHSHHWLRHQPVELDHQPMPAIAGQAVPIDALDDAFFGPAVPDTTSQLETAPGESDLSVTRTSGPDFDHQSEARIPLESG